VSAFTKHFQDDDRFITYIANPKKQDIRLYWKNEQGENFRSIQSLKSWLDKQGRKLVFAMNGGMYNKIIRLRDYLSKMKE